VSPSALHSAQTTSDTLHSCVTIGTAQCADHIRHILHSCVTIGTAQCADHIRHILHSCGTIDTAQCTDHIRHILHSCGTIGTAQCADHIRHILHSCGIFCDSGARYKTADLLTFTYLLTSISYTMYCPSHYTRQHITVKNTFSPTFPNSSNFFLIPWVKSHHFSRFCFTTYASLKRYLLQDCRRETRCQPRCIL